MDSGASGPRGTRDRPRGARSVPDLSETLVTPDGLVTVTTAPPPRRRWWHRLRRGPEPSAADAFRDLIADRWLGLSAAAYQGYRRHGAGAIGLLADPDGSGSIRADRPVYVTQVHTLPGATRADFDGWSARQLETYDPRAEALVVVARPDGITGYLVRGSVPPPQALRSASAPLN